MRRHHHSRWIAIAMMTGCSTSPDLASRESGIRFPTYATPGELTAMVTVSGALDQSCTGFAIGPDTVLTAAHCVCTADWVGGNICAADARVRFVSDATSTRPRRGLSGIATAHPDYNPAWTDQQIDHDLAVIRLSGVAPAFVEPFELASAGEFPALHTPVIVAGYGRTGGDCDTAGDAAAYDPTTVSFYDDGHDVLGIRDDVACPGDSGGPVLDVAMRRAFAVSSLKSWGPIHGWDLKTTTIGAHAGWIHERVCASSRLNTCGIANDRCSCTSTSSVVSQDPGGTVRLSAIAAGTVQSVVTLGTPPPDSTLVGTGDLDGDRRDDLVWRDTRGNAVAWLVREDKREERTLGKLDPAARVQAIADLDGDGLADLVHAIGGVTTIWYAGDPARAESSVTTERVVAGGDFAGNGVAELVWQGPKGEVTIGKVWRGVLEPERWHVAAVGDLDGNTRTDLVWRAGDGRVQIWFDGEQRDPEDPDEPSVDNAGEAIDPAWQLAGVADLDHDGRDDLAWRTGSGLVVWSMAGARVVATARPTLDDRDVILGLARASR
jgi:V8-like Glu-specific endopeptidase